MSTTTSTQLSDAIKLNVINNNNNNNNGPLDVETTTQIWPNHRKSIPSSTPESPILYPLECIQSSPLPLTNNRSSSISSDFHRQQYQQQQPGRRRTTTPDLGTLNAEEQAALEAEITARRQARRASRRLMSYSDLEDSENEYDYDDDRVVIGTRVSEGHRNYQLM